MRKRRFPLVAFVLVLLPVLAIGTAQAGPSGGAPSGMTGPAGQSSAPAGGGHPPMYFNYQGLLRDSAGDPVVDDHYQITFAIYDVITDGVALWGETQTVATEDGLFSVLLGSVTAITQPTWVDGRYLWLGVTLPGEPEMEPRILLASVPYAVNASDVRHAAIHPYSVEAVAYGTAISGTATPASGSFYGVYGASNSPDGAGVYGQANTTLIIGTAGVQTGYSPADVGLWPPGGFFGGRNGVIGISKESGGYGVYGQNQTTAGEYSIGVYGASASSTGWAGYFWNGVGNGVYVSGALGKLGLAVAGGTKNAVVATDAGARLLYSEESSEVWFSDYGFGQLRDGRALVAIDPLFAQTVDLAEPYHVFVQVYGDAEVYVSSRSPQSFVVQLREGDPDVEFSYRLVAKRLGYEDHRLEPAPWADDDPNLYPGMDQAGGKQPGVQGGRP